MKLIALSGSLGKNKYALVDDEWFDELNQYKWKLSKIGNYVTRSKYKNNTLRLHRIISGAKGGEQVDHINRNKLDNRKENLRIVTNQQNSFNSGDYLTNTSGHKGVSWDKEKEKWEANICVDYKKKFLGYFSNKIDAAKAYLAAKEIYHAI